MASGISRAGRFVRQPAGYRAFIPAPLPPNPPIQLDQPTIALLSRADQAVGRLDGVARTLPNPDLFLAMYVRREAVDSSQIEGTRSTFYRIRLHSSGIASVRPRAGVPSPKGYPATEHGPRTGKSDVITRIP